MSGKGRGVVLADLISIAVLVGLAVHRVARGMPFGPASGRRERRDRTLQRLAAIVAQAGGKPGEDAPVSAWTPAAANLRRYSVPAGLRLDQARLIVAAGRLADEEPTRARASVS